MELTDEQWNALADLFPDCSIDVLSHIDEFSTGFKIVVLRALDA